MRERLAYAVFEAMGIAAPQIAHARLTVNDEYWGVYTLVEPVSKPFLKTRLGEESGNLFDYEYAADWDFTFRGPESGAYVPAPFQPQTNEDKLDPSGLIEFVRAVNELPEATFSRDIASYIDVDRFLTYLAVENALAEYDGFVGDFGVNNFYLYQYGDQNRFVFIPWDKDTTFSRRTGPSSAGSRPTCSRGKLLADPAQQAVYLAALRRAAGYVNARFLGAAARAGLHADPRGRAADTKKQVSNNDFELAVGGLRGIIAARERTSSRRRGRAASRERRRGRCHGGGDGSAPCLLCASAVRCARPLARQSSSRDAGACALAFGQSAPCGGAAVGTRGGAGRAAAARLDQRAGRPAPAPSPVRPPGCAPARASAGW